MSAGPGAPAAGAPAAASACGDAHCITCSDEGIPMRVLAIDDGIAVCADADGGRHEVMIDLVPATVGDPLLVHAGVAIALLERER